MRRRGLPLGLSLVLPVLLAGLIGGAGFAVCQDPDPVPRGLGAPDASAVIAELGFNTLPAAVPVLYPAEFGEEFENRARDRQVRLLEARAFWWNLIGALPESGLLFVDSPRWTACATSRSYGFPATRIWSDSHGLLTMLPVETATTFSEDAAVAARVAPTVHRSHLLAHGLADEAGAAACTEAWSWILLGESLVGTLRIEAPAWWQRRLVGATAAVLFLSSPRGRELAPDQLTILEAWSRFWTGYAESVALDLRTCGTGPPEDGGPASLELDARLFLLGQEIWHRQGTDAFGLYRRAWPIGSRFATVAAALDTLTAVMPGIAESAERLCEPRREEPPRP